jgi:hypothetical protein
VSRQRAQPVHDLRALLRHPSQGLLLVRDPRCPDAPWALPGCPPAGTAPPVQTLQTYLAQALGVVVEGLLPAGTWRHNRAGHVRTVAVYLADLPVDDTLPLAGHALRWVATEVLTTLDLTPETALVLRGLDLLD